MTPMIKARVFVAVTVLAVISGLALIGQTIATDAQTLNERIDYNGITGYKQQLYAVYSLLEQLRVEHNGVVEELRESVDLVSDTAPGALYYGWCPSGYAVANTSTNIKLLRQFRYYANESKRLHKELLHEQSRLQEILLWSTYSWEEWKAVCEEGDDAIAEAYLSLYGNATAEKVKETVATAAALEELKALELTKLPQKVGLDPTEDFTSYTETDEGGDITKNATTIVLTAAESRSDTYYVYDDKGAAHFDEDWEHLVRFEFTSSGGSNAMLVPWCVSNTTGDYEDISSASEDLICVFAFDWTTDGIDLREIDDGTTYYDRYSGAILGTEYWVEIERDDDAGAYGTAYAYICDDAYWDDGGNQIDSLSQALHDKNDYQYIYATMSRDTNSAGLTTTGFVKLLDLQEISPPTVTTNTTTSVEDTTATLQGDVRAINDSSITDRGFAWGTTSNATTPSSAQAPNATSYSSDWCEHGSYGTGSFSHGVTSLTEATTYYVRAAAYNDDDLWGWGAELSFLTKPAPPTYVAATDGVHQSKVVVTWVQSAGNVTGYKIYRDAGLIDTIGDVATYDDTGADAPTVTPGAASATDGVFADKVTLSVAGESANPGTTHTYKVRAYNAAGDSDDSDTDTGYRGVGSLTYQWYSSWNCTEGNYSQIGGGTTDPYDDVNAPNPYITANNATACDGCSGLHVTLSCNETTHNGPCRYYLASVGAGGASSQNSTADSGYKGTSPQTFQWWRSWNATAGNYSQIAGGTTDPYNDTGGATTPDYRWYLTTVSMTGATSVNSSADSGYMSGVNVTAVYVYPAYDQEPTSTNQSVWCIVWDDEGLGVGYNVSWNTTGVGSILWCENWTGADGRADLICTSNVTGNQTICAESNGFSDCGLTVWTQGTGEDLPVWYFVLLGCAIVGAWYTKDIILFIMGIIASGGMIYWVDQSSLDDHIRYALIAVFVILAGVLLLQMLMRGQFSFVRGGDSE